MIMAVQITRAGIAEIRHLVCIPLEGTNGTEGRKVTKRFQFI